MVPDSEARKLLIVDTSVLLYDKDSIIRMTGNDVYIPLVVLEELDKFKDKSGILGESARHINRFLDSLRSLIWIFPRLPAPTTHIFNIDFFLQINKVI